MMFESSQFETTAGGGFVSSQSTDPSPASAKSRDNQPMYPVTVKQIIEATPSTDDKPNFLIDGVDVYNVKLIGMVFDKSERLTDVSFVIDDGTGRIGCHRWVNDPHDTNEVEGLRDGIYVRIHGHLRSFQGKKQLVVYAIRPVNDYNEIANHFLECIHAHCCSSKLQEQNRAPVSAPLSINAPNGSHAVSSSQISQEYNLDGLGSIDKMVLDYLQLPSSLAQEKGVHRNEIAQKLKIPQEKILEAMEALESEGLVYSTIDEFHYKSTAS
ncbi:replication protein A 32 kDa subunit A isoform X1 [Sesamum indicum]|uniref:Replication protein A 32 kDa subunit A isoform X1 n=1 Tax=Sesamum indicum TaxID=4182 RepID=A0A6I9SKK8_SESIN|nr:replication protein A 32 kDa subunit A isoform X1 [Sesamum indicum]